MRISSLILIGAVSLVMSSNAHSRFADVPVQVAPGCART